MTGHRYVGIDLGASNLRAVLGDADGTVIARTWQPTPAGGGSAADGSGHAESAAETRTAQAGARTAADGSGSTRDAHGPGSTRDAHGSVADADTDTGRAVQAAIRSVIETVTSEAGVAPTSVAGAGVAAAGPIDRSAGTVRPTNLPVEQVDVTTPAAETIDGPTRLVNDADAGALAEHATGDGPANLAYLTISSGIGAGVIADGALLGGANGNAAEVGHTVVDPEGRLQCGCGSPGHWEAYCSGDNLPRFARLIAETTDLSTELSLRDLDAATLCEAVGTDPLADRTLARAQAFNAIGVADLIHAYAPERVVFGGSVALNNPALIVDPLREAVSDRLVVTQPELTTTELGDWVGARGALAAAAAD